MYSVSKQLFKYRDVNVIVIYPLISNINLIIKDYLCYIEYVFDNVTIINLNCLGNLIKYLLYPTWVCIRNLIKL